MGRHVIRLVIVALLALMLTPSCGLAEANRPIYVEDDFDDEETASILLAIETWNAVGREHVGQDLIDYRGLYSDANGFNLDVNVGDGIPVIYKVSNERVFHELTDHQPGYIAGMRIGGDIVLFPMVLNMDPQQPYLMAVQSVSLHELGHWLGLPDEFSPKHRDSVMYWTRTVGDPLKLTPTKYDIDNICQIYGCSK